MLAPLFVSFTEDLWFSAEPLASRSKEQPLASEEKSPNLPEQPVFHSGVGCLERWIDLNG
jgi:hypothetical protein